MLTVFPLKTYFTTESKIHGHYFVFINASNMKNSPIKYFRKPPPAIVYGGDVELLKVVLG